LDLFTFGDGFKEGDDDNSKDPPDDEVLIGMKDVDCKAPKTKQKEINRDNSCD
jgi:hypothetical protein